MIASFSLRHFGTVHLLQLSKSATAASVDNITSWWTQPLYPEGSLLWLAHVALSSQKLDA